MINFIMVFFEATSNPKGSIYRTTLDFCSLIHFLISCIRSTVPVCPLVLCSLSLSVPDRLKLNTSCFQEMTV